MVPLPHLILSSIRFLPLLKDGHAVVDKLLDILTTATCPLDVQKEIIFSLPHTVSDAQHERIGVALKVKFAREGEDIGLFFILVPKVLL